MSKATYLKDLNHAHFIESSSRSKKARAPYKNMDKDRWVEVCNAHNRKVLRKAKRAVGKANKNGCRRTAMGLRGFLNELNMWAQFTNVNRQGSGIPKRVYRINHRGVISHG
ncbi:TPA: hypothetical protein ACF3P8_002617 [Serratia marcescens]